MSGGEPSSIKQNPPCAVDLPVSSRSAGNAVRISFRLVGVRSYEALFGSSLKEWKAGR